MSEGVSAVLQVTVVLRDVNDNRPVFSQSTYRASVNENTPVGTTVAIVSATDGDSGTNGEVTYSLGVQSSETLSYLLSVKQ